MSGFNLADLFEIVVDAAPNREVLVSPPRRLTLAQLDERANRLADVLSGLGVGRGHHVGLQLVNGTEYVEGMLACFKLSAVPINLNYRYVEAELRYLYEDADLVIVIHHRQFSSRIALVARDTAKLEHLIVVGDSSDQLPPPGAIDYEKALAAADPARPHNPSRNGDDWYIAYTGGTTGMPKGVVWRQEDIFFAGMGGGDPTASGDEVRAPQALAERLPEVGLTMLAAPPMMHVSSQWAVFLAIFTGGRIVFPPPGNLDPDAILRLMVAERVNLLVVVGDAMARPLAGALQRAQAAGTPYELSALLAIGSGGATLSATARRQLGRMLPNVMILDGLGSSETGILGTQPRDAADTSQQSRFTVNAQTCVLDEQNRPVRPGSGIVGRLARKGHVPLGYYKHEQDTSSAFLDVGGERWVLPGDHAMVDADGTVILLGRGSTCVNTGGEKVYPEEVEVAILSAPEVADAVVVGVPDERWGEQVVAIIRPAPGETLSLDRLQDHLRQHLAGFKVPRSLVIVDAVERTPAGKPDYKWAREYAMSAEIRSDSGPGVRGQGAVTVDGTSATR